MSRYSFFRYMIFSIIVAVVGVSEYASAQQTGHAKPSYSRFSDVTPDNSTLTAGSRPINGAEILYPPDMEAAGKEGSVVVQCDIEVTGYTSNCELLQPNQEESFNTEALRYTGQAQYQPATRNGVPVKELGHRLIINFSLGPND